MGTLDQLRSMLDIGEESVRQLTSSEIVWIEQRVTATLAVNGMQCTIERGFARVIDSDTPLGPGDAISLAPPGSGLLRLRRQQWDNYLWEWCIDNIIDMAPTIDLTCEHDAAYQIIQADEPIQSAPLTLAEAVMGISLRFVSDRCADDVPTDTLLPTAIPGISAALYLNHNRWVCQNDLDRWGITGDMAKDLAETRMKSLVEPEVSVLFLDDVTPVFVLETTGPNVAGLLPYVDSHVPLHRTNSATVIVALANEYVMYVHLADDTTSATSIRAMLERAASEHAHRPGFITPAMYRWSRGGVIETLTPAHNPTARV